MKRHTQNYFMLALLAVLLGFATSAVRGVRMDGPFFEVEATAGEAHVSPWHDTALEAALLKLRRLNVGRFHRTNAPYEWCEGVPSCQERAQVSHRGAARRFVRDALSLIGGPAPEEANSCTDARKSSWNETVYSLLFEADSCWHRPNESFYNAIADSAKKFLGQSFVDVLLEFAPGSHEEDSVIETAMQSEASFVRAFKTALLNVHQSLEGTQVRADSNATNGTCEPKVAFLIDEFDLAHEHSMASIAHLFDSSGARITADALRVYFNDRYADVAVSTTFYPFFCSACLGPQRRHPRGTFNLCEMDSLISSMRPTAYGRRARLLV
jgi:hypothetical protein